MSELVERDEMKPTECLGQSKPKAKGFALQKISISVSLASHAIALSMQTPSESSIAEDNHERS